MTKPVKYHLQDPTWCPGCGIYGIFTAFKRAAAALDLDPEQMVIVTGIGCHGRFNNYFKAYGFHGLHGRALPVATGIKLSNSALQVVVISGDGDAYSIGLAHFIHACRRNINLTCLVVNNRIYALTQGQTSPTSARGFVSISSPFGSKEEALDGPRLGLAAGATFIGRGFSGEVSHLANLIKKAIEHKGLALIDILSPCVIHNKVNTYSWYKQHIYKLDEDQNYDPHHKSLAWAKISAQGKIAIGLIYEEHKPSFETLVCPDEKKTLAFTELKIKNSVLEKMMDKFE
ncbi:MAG: 2-oxoacid:ferredoxin oxidoreductase subunit beta [Candidatus Aminicenantales bacterium]